MDTSAVHGFAKVLETDTLCDRAEANKWLSRTHVGGAPHNPTRLCRAERRLDDGKGQPRWRGLPGQVPPTAHKASCVCLFAKLASDVFRRSIRRVRARFRSMTTNPLPRWECSKEPPAVELKTNLSVFSSHRIKWRLSPTLLTTLRALRRSEGLGTHRSFSSIYPISDNAMLGCWFA